MLDHGRLPRHLDNGWFDKLRPYVRAVLAAGEQLPAFSQGLINGRHHIGHGRLGDQRSHQRPGSQRIAQFDLPVGVYQAAG